jgi:hypothetical protein
MSETQTLLNLDPFAALQEQVFAASVGKLSKLDEVVSAGEHKPDEGAFAGDDGGQYTKLLSKTMREELLQFHFLNPKFIAEAETFAGRISNAKSSDELEDLDVELAAREKVFRQILTRHLWYTWQVSRFILRQAEAEDIFFRINDYKDAQLFERAAQLGGQRGFLTTQSKKQI